MRVVAPDWREIRGGSVRCPRGIRSLIGGRVIYEYFEKSSVHSVFFIDEKPFEHTFSISSVL